MDQEKPFVTFDAVGKTYDGRQNVVQGLDLSIGRGEFVSLLGPSGSGKTTTLMMLAGFETPTEGEISLGGRRLNDLPPHKRNIGMVFQNYALFPHLTIAENVAFPLSVRGVPKAEQRARVARALAMVELPGVAGRRPGQLSGGQQQRIALARALVFEPALVLMDEPLGALDKRLRETMQYEIKRLHHALGLTVVYVTHDQGEALTMSDRVAVFFDGRIQQIAPPQVLYEDPANAFVANFIGENNGIGGRVSRIAGDEACMMVGDVPIVGKAGKALADGAPAVLALRPERAVLNPGVQPGLNRMTATVLDITYCGDHHRVKLGLVADGDFILKVPNNADQALPPPGSAVEVGWRPSDCKILTPPPAG